MRPFTHEGDTLFQALTYLLASVTTNTRRHMPLLHQIGCLRLPHQSVLGVELLPPLPPDPTIGPPSQLLLQVALLSTSLFRSCLRRARPPPVLFIQDPPSSLSVRCVQISSVDLDSQLTGPLCRLSQLVKGNGPNSHEFLALQMAYPPRSRA
jgi:hypothetical protein